MATALAISANEDFGVQRKEIQARIDELRRLRAKAAVEGKKFPDGAALFEAETALEVLGDAEGEIVRQKRIDESRTEAARRAELREQIAEKSAVYFESVAKAEQGAREMCEGLKQAKVLAREIMILFSAIGERAPGGLHAPSWERRFSERLSALLKTVSENFTRFGDIEYATSWRKPKESWLDSEHREIAALLPLIKPKGKDNG